MLLQISYLKYLCEEIVKETFLYLSFFSCCLIGVNIMKTENAGWAILSGLETFTSKRVKLKNLEHAVQCTLYVLYNVYDNTI